MTIPRCDTVNTPSNDFKSDIGSPGQPKRLNNRSQTFPQSSAGKFESNLPAYEGYTYSQVDPVPGQSEAWTRVKESDMDLSQHELYELVQRRGSKKSAAQQYKNLSHFTRQAHINQLIDRQRRRNPHVEWSFVYVKEIRQPCAGPNPRCEIVSMNVILLKMPKTPMYTRAQSRGPGTKRSDFGFETTYRARKQDCSIMRKQSTAAINNAPERPAPSPANSSEMSCEHSSGWSSDGSSDANSKSMLFERADDTSETDDSESTYNGHQEIRSMRPYSRQQPEVPEPGSPRGRESSHTRGKSNSRSLDGRQERTIPFRELPAAKNVGPKRFDRARSRGSVSGRRYRMQPTNENEIRSQMPEAREASIGHREKRLKRSYRETLDLEERQSVKENITPVCHCTCRCAVKAEEGN